MAIKGILFDKDGVLVDFQRTYAPSTAEIIALLSDGNDALAKKMAEAVDFDLRAIAFSPLSPVIAGTAADIANAWQPLLPRRAMGELITRVEDLYDDFTVKYVKPFDDVAVSLERLNRAGMSLGVATNDTEESAHRHLKAIGQTGTFGFISGYDSGHGPKPEPGMVLAFARAIGANPGEVIMIGDSLHDMKAGRAAGAVCVAVTTGLASREVFSHVADHVIDSLSELPDLAASLS